MVIAFEFDLDIVAREALAVSQLGYCRLSWVERLDIMIEYLDCERIRDGLL